ncbi:MAG TPA: dihydrolipoamide acetyltransferase family protein [Blastocatellia bacterium]|nr:dihydrolipoamide acetyltransferase family protein [Blastocatellia bacterium]
MSEEVKMPQMGESIAEGTIVRWLKHVGDSVKRDEPLFEISTDKVDAEIPSPSSGVLSEIKVQEGETVAINTIVAVIDGAGGAGVAGAKPTASAPAAAPPQPAAPEPKAQAPAASAAPPPAPEPPRQAKQAEPASAPLRAPAPAVSEDEEAEQTPDAEGRRIRSSPLVRKIAQEEGVDISQIEGTGTGGRVTKSDILSFVENRRAGGAAAPPALRATQAPVSAPTRPIAQPQIAPQAPQRAPQPLRHPSEITEIGPPPFADGDRYEIEPMTTMRKRIAERMVESRHTSAHVTSFMEIDFTETAKLRDKLKGDFQSRDGVRLTFMPFIIKAVIEGIKKWPILNSSVWGDQIVMKKDINIGIAVALDWGLIVPVIRNADEKSLLGIARAVNDLGDRARSKQLKPDEVQGGTFTITNPGGFGGLVGTPIINQPQVAILGVGVIKKRPVVINDAIAIRQIGYFGLSFDHRIVDGAVADQYLATVRDVIEAANYNS